MITHKIRILNNQTSTCLFRLWTTFTGLELYTYSMLPAWIVPSSTFGYIDYLTFNPTVTGTFSYDFTLGGSPSLADARLIVEVVDSLTDNLPVCNNQNAIALVWITREGGRASYIFDQRKDFSTIPGESKSFDNGGEIKFFNKGKIFDGKIIYKTGLSDNEMTLINSLLDSIQAWEYDESTGESKRIYIQPETFDLPGTKPKINEVIIKYRLAKYKLIQGQ